MQAFLRLIFHRRFRIIASVLMSHLPCGALVLDVGCGDGLLSAFMQAKRPDIRILGADVMRPPSPQIPLCVFDGLHLPFADRTFDVLVFVDVLHHAADPIGLLREGTRLARRSILVKDHVAGTKIEHFTLATIDWTGNFFRQVSLPYNYWSREAWQQAFSALPVVPQPLSEAIPEYHWWLPWLRGRSLQLVARLEVAPATGEPQSY